MHLHVPSVTAFVRGLESCVFWRGPCWVRPAEVSTGCTQQHHTVYRSARRKGADTPAWSNLNVLAPPFARLSHISFFELLFVQFLASAEQFGFHRASPACGGLGQPRQRSGPCDHAVRSRRCPESIRRHHSYSRSSLRLSISRRTRKYLRNAACTLFFDRIQVSHSYTELPQPSRHSGRLYEVIQAR